MAPPTTYIDPTNASKQVLRHSIKRASMMKKHASYLTKRAGLITRRLNSHFIFYITDIEGRSTPADPDFKYWNTSVTDVQQVQSYGGKNYVQVRGYNRPMHYYVKNIFNEPEPSTALYSNPEHARSSTCLSAQSAENHFESFNEVHDIANDSEYSSVASIPDNWEVDRISTHGNASQRTSLTSRSDGSSVASPFASVISRAVGSTTNLSGSTESSQRSPLISTSKISDSAPVLPDPTADFEPFEVHFPAGVSIRISFTLPTQETPSPEVFSPVPSLLRPGLPKQMESDEENKPATQELISTDYLPVIPRFAPFDPYNHAYQPNPAGRYSGMRWTRANIDLNRRRPYTICAPSSPSRPRTPQLAAESIPNSNNELFLSCRHSPRLRSKSRKCSSSTSSNTRPINIDITPSTIPSMPRIIPRKPVHRANHNTSPPSAYATLQRIRAAPLPSDYPIPQTTPVRHLPNLSSRYPRLNTNKPLPTPPSPYRTSTVSGHNRHTPLAHKGNWTRGQRRIVSQTMDEPRGETRGGNQSCHDNPLDIKGQSENALRRRWNKLFGKR